MAIIDLPSLPLQQPDSATELVGRNSNGQVVRIENDFPTREEVTEEIESFVPDLSAYALKIELPTKTSELQNDSGFITDAALTDYVKEEELSEALENYVLESEFVTSQSEQNEEINNNRARIEELEDGLDGYALITEGVLLLDSKYFTPVDNGSGGLQLTGITFQELQDEYVRYAAGVKSIQTNTNGLIGLTVDAFLIDDSLASFQYRFAIGDYSTGVLTVYQVLISGTGGGLIAPVNIIYQIDVSDMVTESNFYSVIQAYFANAQFSNVSIQANGNITETATGNISITSGSTLSLNGNSVLINGSPAVAQSDLSGYVTTDTNQEITGQKTFQNLTTIGVGSSSQKYLQVNGSMSIGRQTAIDTSSGIFISTQGNIYQCGSTPVTYFQNSADGSNSAAIAYSNSTNQLLIQNFNGTAICSQTSNSNTLGDVGRLFANIYSTDATFTNRPKIGGVDAALISDIPIIPTRVKVNHSTAVTFTNNTPVTLSTTATAPDELRSFQNAKISCKLTFQPDAASIGIGGIVNLLISEINMNVRCEFLVNGVSVDSFYFTIARTGRLQTCEFTTVQNISASQVVSIRLTPTISAGTLSIPASSTANYIAIL